MCKQLHVSESSQNHFWETVIHSDTEESPSVCDARDCFCIKEWESITFP